MRRRTGLKKIICAKPKRILSVLRNSPPQRPPIRIVCVCAGGAVSSGDLAKAFLKAKGTGKQKFTIETAGFYVPAHHNTIRSADIILSEIAPATLHLIFERFGIRTWAKIHQASPNPRKMAKLKRTIFTEK